MNSESKVRGHIQTELWLNEGDQNSKFFCLSTVVRRRRNIIAAIKEGDNLVIREEKTADYFLSNFEKIFKSNTHRLDVNFGNLFQDQIIEEDNNILFRTPIEEEIKESF